MYFEKGAPSFHEIKNNIEYIEESWFKVHQLSSIVFRTILLQPLIVRSGDKVFLLEVKSRW